MKIQITKTETSEIEVSLPFYRKNGCHYYKVFSEKHALTVCDLKGLECIQSSFTSIDATMQDCSSEEFESKLKEVTEILTTK